MSTHTLVSFDGDLVSNIEKDPQGFVESLLRHLRNPDSVFGLDLEYLRHYYGVTTYGARHHSSPYTITWGFTHTHIYQPGNR